MSERRPEDYDRDFAELVSGLELGGGPDNSPSPSEPPDLSGAHTPPRAPAPEPDWFSLGDSLDRAEPDEPDPSEWKPEPQPIPQPRGPALVSLGLFGYCAIILVLVIVGIQLPVWVAWTAVAAFVTAMLIGWRALPRDRDPGDGDGAVL